MSPFSLATRERNPSGSRRACRSTPTNHAPRGPGGKAADTHTILAEMIAVVLNTASGTARRPGVAEEIGELFRKAGMDATIEAIDDPRDIAIATRDAMKDGADVIVAAGGDGTVSAVAAELAGKDTPLGVLPLGTLNHFARDAGITTRSAQSGRHDRRRARRARRHGAGQRPSVHQQFLDRRLPRYRHAAGTAASGRISQVDRRGARHSAGTAPRIRDLHPRGGRPFGERSSAALFCSSATTNTAPRAFTWAPA